MIGLQTHFTKGTFTWYSKPNEKLIVQYVNEFLRKILWLFSLAYIMVSIRFPHGYVHNHWFVLFLTLISEFSLCVGDKAETHTGQRDNNKRQLSTHPRRGHRKNPIQRSGNIIEEVLERKQKNRTEGSDVRWYHWYMKGLLLSSTHWILTNYTSSAWYLEHKDSTMDWPHSFLGSYKQ